jgi:hypothetical protein
MVYGPPKCGKSFAVLHIAYAVSQGRAVWERRVKQCPVLYLALEGGAGLDRRVKVLAEKYGDSEAFFYVTQPVPLFAQPELADDVITAASSIGAKFIVIDTHHRALAAGDDNTSRDTGALIGLYDKIRAATGAHLCVVHHTGKDESRGSRGSNALLAGVDASLKVAKDEAAGSSAIVAEDVKDEPAGDTFNFRLKAVEVGGPDEDGETPTTCVLEELDTARADKAGPRPIRLTPKERTRFDMILGLFNDRGDLVVAKAPAPGMPIVRTVIRSHLRDYLIQRGELLANEDGNPKTEKNRHAVAVQKLLEALRHKGKIGFDRDCVWLLDGGNYHA